MFRLTPETYDSCPSSPSPYRLSPHHLLSILFPRLFFSLSKGENRERVLVCVCSVHVILSHSVEFYAHYNDA